MGIENSNPWFQNNTSDSLFASDTTGEGLTQDIGQMQELKTELDSLSQGVPADSSNVIKNTTGESGNIYYYLQDLLDVLEPQECKLEWRNGFLDVYMIYEGTTIINSVMNFPENALLPSSSFKKDDYGKLQGEKTKPWKTVPEVFGTIFSFSKRKLPTVDEIKRKHERRNKFLLSEDWKQILYNWLNIERGAPKELLARLLYLPGSKEEWRSVLRPFSYGIPRELMMNYAIENRVVSIPEDLYVPEIMENFNREYWEGAHPEAVLETYKKELLREEAEVYAITVYNKIRQGSVKAYWNGAYLEFEVDGNKFPAGYVPKCYLRTKGGMGEVMKVIGKEILTDPNKMRKGLGIITKALWWLSKWLARIGITFAKDQTLWQFLSKASRSLGTISNWLARIFPKLSFVESIVLQVLIDIAWANIEYGIGSRRQKKRYQKHYKSWEDWEEEQKRINGNQDKGQAAARELSAKIVTQEIEKKEQSILINAFSFAGVTNLGTDKAGEALASAKKKTGLTDDAIAALPTAATDEISTADRIRAWQKKGMPKENAPLEVIPERMGTELAGIPGLYEIPGYGTSEGDGSRLNIAGLLGIGKRQEVEPIFDIDPGAVEPIEDDMTDEECMALVMAGLKQYSASA